MMEKNLVKTMMWELVLISISNHKETYPARVTREVYLMKGYGCMDFHISYIIKDLEALGWVESYKRGRLKVLSITKKGNEIADSCKVIQKAINQ